MTLTLSVSDDTLLIGALVVTTQVILVLYGAGLRRPFGSLKTITFLPRRYREADHLVLAADLAFAAFIIAMWSIIFYASATFSYPAVLGFVIFSAGDFLSNRISLKTSLCIAIGLSGVASALAVVLLLR
jgi:hypothetical protein